MKKIKIGIDFHGVLDTHTDFFKHLTNMISEKSKYEVHIITGTSFSNLLDWLIKNEIKFDHFYSITDDFIKKGYETIYVGDKGHYFNSEAWDKAKSLYCLKHNIEIMYDDNIEYLKYFKTPYKLVDKDFIYGDMLVNEYKKGKSG